MSPRGSYARFNHLVVAEQVDRTGLIRRGPVEVRQRLGTPTINEDGETGGFQLFSYTEVHKKQAVEKW